jgi:hypothetical protein
LRGQLKNSNWFWAVVLYCGAGPLVSDFEDITSNQSGLGLPEQHGTVSLNLFPWFTDIFSITNVGNCYGTIMLVSIILNSWTTDCISS